MPNIAFNPERMPTRQEARELAPYLKRKAEIDPDADESDWQLYHLVVAYSRGLLVLKKD